MATHIMFEIFRTYLEEQITLTEADYDQIAAVSIIRPLLKRQFLLQEGQVWRYNAFVCKGFLRTFFTDDKGEEHIMNFAPEHHWSGDRDSLASEKPSKYNIEALEDTTVLLIKKEPFDLLCKNIPVFNDLVNAILQRRFVVMQDRIQANITYSAEEKYHHFLTKNPSIANRIPQHMIASYLGISTETISRIRKQSTPKRH